MNLQTLLAPLLNVLSGFAVIGAVVLSIAVILGGLLVYRVGAANALAFFRREGKFVGGQFYESDVVRAAMVDLHQQKRRGVLLDREANEALRVYQFGEKPKRNRGGW